MPRTVDETPRHGQRAVGTNGHGATDLGSVCGQHAHIKPDIVPAMGSSPIKANSALKAALVAPLAHLKPRPKCGGPLLMRRPARCSEARHEIDLQVVRRVAHQ